MFIVSTTGDCIDTYDTPILNEISLNSIADFHGLEKKNIHILKCHSRAPMMAVETAEELNRIVYDWIDDL